MIIARLSTFLLVFACLQAAAQKRNDTFSVYFELDVASLNSKAQLVIDSLFYVEKIKKGVPVSIIGYADYLATDEYNLELSRERATNVKSYLTRSGLDDRSIKLLLGKGEVKRIDTVVATKGIPRDRRVDIVMEYEKPSMVRPDAHPYDTTIVMKPSEKLLVPPSSSDPGFDITQIPKGKTFILKNIYFPMGRHFPRESSYEDLNMLLEAMKENPYLAIQIEGHVCCISNVPDAYDLDSHQMDLSFNRARFIYEYLKARGIDAARLKYIGFGKSKPIIADEQTQEEAAINRRVEIRILDK
jgi:outer membrane protein OmpA-like peptidoglycan-associated protein